MKSSLLLFFCLLSITVFAHDARYHNSKIKTWSIVAENKTVEGTFLMYKDGKVFIEDVINNIVNYPLTSFSEQDQEQILRQYKRITDLNKKHEDQHAAMSAVAHVFNYKFWTILLFIGLVCIYLYSEAGRRKLKYIVPIFLIFVIASLYSFTTKIIKALQTTTDPAFMNSAFTPFVPQVNTFWDANYFYVESKGIPTTHFMMVGISNHGWQQQVPIPQCYIGANAWPIPLNPVVSANPIPVDAVHFTRGAIAIAVNGVPIFNYHTNTGVDSYIDGQLDNYGGHCGRGDDYHYHIAPLHLYDHTTATLPIAFGLDGYAVYGAIEPDGSTMTTLDGNHGHYGTDGVYHYHGTVSAPYMIGNMVGEVTEDGTHQLIPQAAAHPVRTENWTPLNGALITSCTPNGTNNGYDLSYTLNGTSGYATNFSWNTLGVYTFNYLTPSGTTTTNYNGFVQCEVPISTGTNETPSAENNLLIFPNPNNGEFKLKFTNDEQQKDVKEILIYNMQGGLAFKTDQYQKNLSIKNLAQGSYLVKVQFENSQVTRRLIVQ